MIKKRKSGGGGGANWMDTYGDMVTLLLCFFVLLYSMSTLDQQKWLEVVRSFNPDAIPEVTETKGNDGTNADPVTAQSEIEVSIDQLYEALQAYIDQQGAAENISVSKGDGYVFLSLNDAVFFDGDSYELRDDGKRVLDDVGIILSKAKDSIDELRILGHTAQATANDPNNPTVDRFLASNRATVVLVYLQTMDVLDLDPARMVSVGYGQWRPVAQNDTPTERAKNRRVEIIIAGKDMENYLGDSIRQYYTSRQSASLVGTSTDGGDTAPSTDEVAPP